MNKSWLELDRAFKLAQIVSLVATPVVLAIFGGLIQATLSDAGIKKDYVRIALDVLRDAPTKGNEELRQWALSVLDHSSPVPVPPGMKIELRQSPLTIPKWLPNSEEKYTPRVECVPAPDPTTVEWLLKAFPEKFARCPAPNEIGTLRLNLPAGLDWTWQGQIPQKKLATPPSRD